jgi:superfamily I DNA/RNA helicase
MKARFVVGPPGTGKTHIWIVKRYKKLLKEYGPENIILLSHTNEAVEQTFNCSNEN